LQYAIAQVVSNIVLVVGIFFVLENAGIHLAALAVVAGAVGVCAKPCAMQTASTQLPIRQDLRKNCILLQS